MPITPTPRPERSLARPVIVLAVAALVLAACAAGPNSVAAGPDAAGFWPGLWHGVISPVTFLISLFNDQVNVYEVRNSGNWYDFGFMLGISAVFSGPLSARRSVPARSRR